MTIRHKSLNEQGKGPCSVPMWSGMGIPAGTCGKPAYGERPPCKTFRNAITGEVMRRDGKFNGYIPGLACPTHGGPRTRTFMDGNQWCAVHPDFINLQESPAGFGSTQEDAIKELART